MQDTRSFGCGCLFYADRSKTPPKRGFAFYILESGNFFAL